MQKIEEIKKSIEWGDIRDASRITGYSERAIRLILAGQRNDHRNVLGVLQDIIDNRIRIKENYALDS